MKYVESLFILLSFVNGVATSIALETYLNNTSTSITNTTLPVEINTNQSKIKILASLYRVI